MLDEKRIDRLKDKIDEVFDALSLIADPEDLVLVDHLTESRSVLHSAANQIIKAQYGDAIRSRRTPLNFDGDEDGYDEDELSF